MGSARIVLLIQEHQERKMHYLWTYPVRVNQRKIWCLNTTVFYCCFHPETLSQTSTTKQISELLTALRELTESYNFIFIGSNSDTGSDEIMKEILRFCQLTNSRLFKSVKPEEYLALNKYSQGLIGNSSSGLIEIPSLLVPTINIGNRQKEEFVAQQ